MALQKAASLSDLKEGEITGVEIGEAKVALYLVDGQPLATSGLCTHQECPLSEEGEVVGNEVHCLCHGSKFDIRTGEVIDPPAQEPLATYPVQVQGQDVLVDLP
jgi:3-phenylpropionate/trans-cinnamate dioxygenase ferredoxin subunit